MRLRDEILANDAAKWLAGKNASSELVEQIQGLSPQDPRDPERKVPRHRRGESIMRDAQAGSGKSGGCSPSVKSGANRS